MEIIKTARCTKIPQGPGGGGASDDFGIIFCPKLIYLFGLLKDCKWLNCYLADKIGAKMTDL